MPRFGGNPVCSAGGRAVLRVLHEERRQEHCKKVGFCHPGVFTYADIVVTYMSRVHGRWAALLFSQKACYHVGLLSACYFAIWPVRLRPCGSTTSCLSPSGLNQLITEAM